MSRRYTLYIDESGDHVFRDEESLRLPQHRFLALLGCVSREDHYLEFHNDLTRLKQEHFPHSPDDPVILHRSAMINRRGPFWRLREPDRRDAFERGLLNVLGAATFRVVLILVDKLELLARYLEPWHPYHMALGFMLQRYCGYLNHTNATGNVTAESRGRVENELLSSAYDHIYAHGDRFHRAEWYQRALTSKKLKLRPKDRNISGLQLCDILAYPLKQRYLHDKGLLPKPRGRFGEMLAEAVEGKYNRHLYDGRVEGYGRVLFPK